MNYTKKGLFNYVTVLIHINFIRSINSMRLTNDTVIPKRDKTVLLLKVLPIIRTRLNHKDIYTYKSRYK